VSKQEHAILGSFGSTFNDAGSLAGDIPAGMVSAKIPVSFVANSAIHHLIRRNTHGNDRRRSLENGKRQRSQIR
jgi:hypothetical protein